MTRYLRTTITISLLGASAFASQATDTTIEPMPATLETQFALSALLSRFATRQPYIFLIPRRAINSSGREQWRDLSRRAHCVGTGRLSQRHLRSSLLRR